MAKPFTLTQLRYFSVVAELENMTAAAERLLVTQSTLSTAIAQLESSLSTQLFVRLHTRGLRLTPSGRHLAQDIKVLLEHADSLYESARGLAAGLVGELKVGVFAPLAPFRLPAILQTFEVQHPGVEVSFLEADLATLQSALLDGQCDVALMYGLGLGRGFTYKVLDRVPPHVLVHAAHPAAARPDRSIALRDLDGEPSVVLDLPHSREYYEQLYALAGVVPNVRHRFAGYETVRSFVAKGHGYAMLNQRLNNDMTYSGGKVVVLALTDNFPPIEVMLVRPEGVQPTRRTLAFEETCHRVYGSAGPAASLTESIG
ncbi:LysR family transcriptional regulator [Arthrobacter sp. PGP41]|uniref:LysR family transcriptional regulator n=1 Tax=unclassified Arthrobacter TaxID=235627 RepID=UPI000CDC105A|nr:MULTISPECIES: LysR family transcriptional regulator [unclassified Arthrobacter]AUZ36405.1 LysR family transcriptional regulator [Arthrobacter sp. PGP41]MDT0197074.1 LysR family transcriptional regulator [Arthrobacter sp. AB6]